MGQEPAELPQNHHGDYRVLLCAQVACRSEASSGGVGRDRMRNLPVFRIDSHRDLGDAQDQAVEAGQGRGLDHGSPATLLLVASVDLEEDSVQTRRRGRVPDPLSAHRSAA